MIFSDKTIRTLMAGGQLVIEPMEPGQVQPASVDIRLGRSFSVMGHTGGAPVEMNQPLRYEHMEADRYLIAPGQFVLATTMEYFRLPDNMTAFVLSLIHI